MVFEYVAKRLQTATHGRLAWFGEFWPYFLLVQTIDLLLTAVSTLAQQLVLSLPVARTVICAIGLCFFALAMVSLLLDESLVVPRKSVVVQHLGTDTASITKSGVSMTS